MNPGNQIPTENTGGLPVSQNPPQFTPPVQMPNTTPQPELGFTPVQPLPQEPPTPLPSKQFHFPMWPLQVLAVIVLLISFLLSLSGYMAVQRDQKLSKVGKVTEAVVVSVQNSQVPDPTNTNNENHTLKTTTLVTYRLDGISGYGNQQFTQAPPVQPGTVLSPGQQLQVMYDPANPARNDLKANVKSDQSAISLYTPWLFFIIPLAIIIVISMFIRRFVRRAHSIETLSV